MTVVILFLLLVSALLGLVAGSRRAVLPPVAAVIPCAVLGGIGTAGLALLASAGMAAGVRLHQVVAEDLG